MSPVGSLKPAVSSAPVAASGFRVGQRLAPQCPCLPDQPPIRNVSSNLGRQASGFGATFVLSPASRFPLSAIPYRPSVSALGLTAGSKHLAKSRRAGGRSPDQFGGHPCQEFTLGIHHTFTYKCMRVSGAAVLERATNVPSIGAPAARRAQGCLEGALPGRA